MAAQTVHGDAAVLVNAPVGPGPRSQMMAISAVICNNITSFYGSPCANNGKDALSTPETLPLFSHYVQCGFDNDEVTLLADHMQILRPNGREVSWVYEFTYLQRAHMKTRALPFQCSSCPLLTPSKSEPPPTPETRALTVTGPEE
eukprot:5000340-Pyramimonas_sp.AAC.1